MTEQIAQDPTPSKCDTCGRLMLRPCLHEPGNAYERARSRASAPLAALQAALAAEPAVVAFGALSRPQARALRNAALRPRGTVCPVFGVVGAAETTLLNALERKGLVSPLDEQGCKAPTITAAGRALVAASGARMLEGPRCMHGAGAFHTRDCDTCWSVVAPPEHERLSAGDVASAVVGLVMGIVDRERCTCIAGLPVMVDCPVHDAATCAVSGCILQCGEPTTRELIERAKVRGALAKCERCQHFHGASVTCGAYDQARDVFCECAS